MASKLTDTELTVGTDGHKITGVDADGKALTSGSDLNANTVDGYHAGASAGMLCPIVACNFGSSSGYVKWGNGLIIQWTSRYNDAQYFYIDWPVSFSSTEYIVVDAAWATSGSRLPEEFVMAREVSRIKIGTDTWNERDAKTFVIGIGT